MKNKKFRDPDNADLDAFFDRLKEGINNKEDMLDDLYTHVRGLHYRLKILLLTPYKM